MNITKLTNKPLRWLLAVAILAAMLISYLKIIEEKELQMRFGDEYIEYKKKTPFMIPITLGKK